MNPSHFRPTGRLLGALALARLVCGCASIPNGRAAVDSVDLHGARQLDSSDVTDELATAPSPKFLGLFRGVLYEYALFSRGTLQRVLARVERYDRARGYYDAHATGG